MNTMYNDSKSDCLREQAARLLSESAIPLESAAWDAMLRHAALLREWNEFASLVSVPDLEHLVSRHIVDSLSLAPFIRDCTASGGMWLDIGSGGGFPSIPVKCLLPSLSLVLLERNAKKVGFLRKAAGALGFSGISLVQGEFPVAVADSSPAVVTARAVERPGEVLRRVLAFLPEGSTFLCQSGQPGKEIAEMFHVEHVEDAWASSGLRRGTLYKIKRVG